MKSLQNCEIVSPAVAGARAGAHEFRGRYVSAEPLLNLIPRTQIHEKRIRTENDVLVKMYNSPGASRGSPETRVRGRRRPGVPGPDAPDAPGRPRDAREGPVRRPLKAWRPINFLRRFRRP